LITTRSPADWRDLQRQVALVLHECGLKVELEKKVQTARGMVEIDVFAVELLKGREITILAECKHWSRAVPQSVIHGFRTVVAETGANAGYVVSKSGFQPGANEAAGLTSLRLVTWEGFQAEFEQLWVDHYLVPAVAVCGWALLTHKSLERPMGGDVPYSGLMILAAKFTLWLDNQRDGYHSIPQLPLRETAPSLPAELPYDDLLDARGYRDLLEALLGHSQAAIVQSRAAIGLAAGGLPTHAEVDAAMERLSALCVRHGVGERGIAG
jgi:hypothetical protein